jgi:hypothetical protein
MKKMLLFVVAASLQLFVYQRIDAQCTADPACTDIGNPGEMCPTDLPPATVNVPYSQVLTIIPPASFNYNGNNVPLAQIELTNVENLPSGITYQCNPSNCKFVVTNPITKYCALLSGTPTQPGTYQLKVHVMPYISIGGAFYPTTEQVDDTSLVMVVNNASLVEFVNTSKFTVLVPQPNPFNATVTLSYYSPAPYAVTLQIYNVLGNKIYEEKMISSKGENVFKFNGATLKSGVYIYSVNNGKEHITKQLIKN